MSKFMSTVCKETKEAADKFIERIKNGTITKRKLANTSEDFNIEVASESFENLVTSDKLKKLMKNTCN